MGSSACTNVEGVAGTIISGMSGKTKGSYVSVTVDALPKIDGPSPSLFINIYTQRQTIHLV